MSEAIKPKSKPRGAMVAQTCQCGKEYQARAADLARGWGRYCSKSCAAKFRQAKGETMTEVDPNDIRIFSWSSKRQGAYGLFIPTGVHIIHLPTGLEVKVDADRSQHRNKDQALLELKEKLNQQARGE